MTKQFFILLVIGFLFVFSPSQVTHAEEDTYEIKLISKLDLSDYMTSLNQVAKHENLLWVTGMRRIHSIHGNFTIFAIDVSNPAEPEVVASHRTNQHFRSLSFYQKYMYVINRKVEERRRYPYLEVYDVSDPQKLNLISSQRLPHRSSSELIIKGDSLFIVGTERSTLAEARIFKYSLDDPQNPEFVSDTFSSQTGNKEWDFMHIGMEDESYFILPVQYDNYLAGIADTKFVLFKDTEDGLLLIDGADLPLNRPTWMLAFAGEAIPNQSNYLYVAGVSGYQLEPVDDGYSIRDRYDRLHGIAVVEHRLSTTSSIHREEARGRAAYSVPLEVTGLLANNTLAFVMGVDISQMPEDPRTIDQRQLPSKILILDFKQVANAKIVGEYDFISSAYQYIQDDNLAYLFKINNELEIIELPSSDDFFLRPLIRELDPDETPEKEIEERLSKFFEKPTDEITKEDLASIKSFRMSGQHYTDLEVIKDFTNLESLYIFRTSIHDLSPLENMPNLKSLNLSYSDITDLSPLIELTNLESLKIRDLLVSDYSAISALKNLTKLDLSNNYLSDISFLEGLENLEELNLISTRLESISGLSNLENLRSLTLSRNNITDIEPLSNLVNLETLTMDNNSVSDITPLANMRKLKSLVLFANQIVDVAPLSNLVNLTEVNLTSNQIADVTALSNLKNVTNLSLIRNKIKDISPLSKLHSVEELHLGNNEITDISPIVGLKSLTSLGLSDNKIDDINPIVGLKSLTSLGLSNNKIDDITSLLETKRDEPCIIYLRNNPIGDDELIRLRQQLSLNGWLHMLAKTESDVMNNLVKLASKAVELKEASPDGTFPTFEELKQSDFFDKSSFEKMFLYYELAYYNVTPPGKLPDGTLIEPILRIVMRPTADTRWRSIFGVTEQLEHLEYLGDPKTTDFSEVDFNDDTLWLKR